MPTHIKAVPEIHPKDEGESAEGLVKEKYALVLFSMEVSLGLVEDDREGDSED
jgi:hypothetical protein